MTDRGNLVLLGCLAVLLGVVAVAIQSADFLLISFLAIIGVIFYFKERNLMAVGYGLLFISVVFYGMLKGFDLHSGIPKAEDAISQLFLLLGGSVGANFFAHGLINMPMKKNDDE